MTLEAVDGEKSESQGGMIWREPDRIVKGRSKIVEPLMETGVGAARYVNLNSDLPVCISQDFQYESYDIHDAENLKP